MIGDSLRWRGDPAMLLPSREFIRHQLPGPRQFVAVDIDLIVVRGYGSTYGVDYQGKFRLIEVKCSVDSLTGAQHYTFGLIDEMLRWASTVPRHIGRYYGFHEVYTESGDWATSSCFRVRELPGGDPVLLDQAEFVQWLNFGQDLG